MQSPSPPGASDAPTSGAVIDHLLVDMGLRDHAGVARVWDELRAHPTAVSDHPGRLVRLGHLLCGLRPARRDEVVSTWRRLALPVDGLVVRPLHVMVSGTTPASLTATVDGRTGPVSVSPDSVVGVALRRAIRTAGVSPSLVVHIHLEGLTGELLAAADLVPWEQLLAPLTPGRVHLVRRVAAVEAVDMRKDIATVGFLGDLQMPSARAEEQAVGAVWGQGLQPGAGHADVVHVHAHGDSGAIGGVVAADIRGRLGLFNACEGAWLGGVVRDLVERGRLLDSLGFSEPVLTESAAVVARAVHAELYTWRDEVQWGIVRAALAGRRALGRRAAAVSWRHYQAGPAAPSSRGGPRALDAE